MKTTIWTDGACLYNPGGPGGWAFVAEQHGAPIYQEAGSEESTTNNRMEMMGVIRALEWSDAEKLTIVSDSKYVTDGASSWMPKWKRNGWHRSKRKHSPPKNLELWKALDQLQEGREVRYKWVKGHNGSELNEFADYLADEAMRAFIY